MVRKLLSILLTVLILVSGGPRAAVAQQEAAQNQTEVVSQASIETQFLAEVAEQSEAAMERFHRLNPNIDSSFLETARRLAIQKFRQMNQFKDLAMAYGNTSIKVGFAIEVVTTFVLPAALAPLGLNWLAGASAFLPWGGIYTLIYTSWNATKYRIKIARGLNRWTLGELDQIRSEVLGFEVKHRISSAIYHEVKEGLRQAYGFEVLSKFKESVKANQAPVVSIPELQNLILGTSSSGRRYLESISIDVAYPELYAAHLLRFISNDPAILKKLGQIISQRNPTIGTSRSEAKSILLSLNDQQKQLEKTQIEVQRLIKELNANVKKGRLGKSEGQRIERRLNELSKNIELMRFEVIRAEYVFLNDLRLASGGDLNSALANGRMGLQAAAEETRILRLKYGEEVRAQQYQILETVKATPCSKLVFGF